MIASGGGSAITVTFLIPFTNTMYYIVKNIRFATNGDAYYVHLYCYDCTTTTFKTSNLPNTTWYACGMRGRIMLGTKLYKNNKSDMANYTKTAVWCNANDAHIEDKGSYYEVCENAPPEPTIDEKLVKLDSQYNSEVTRLGNEYMSATLRNDSDTQQELTQEMLELDGWYDTEYNNIIGGDE